MLSLSTRVLVTRFSLGPVPAAGAGRAAPPTQVGLFRKAQRKSSMGREPGGHRSMTEDGAAGRSGRRTISLTRAMPAQRPQAVTALDLDLKETRPMRLYPIAVNQANKFVKVAVCRSVFREQGFPFGFFERRRQYQAVPSGRHTCGENPSSAHCRRVGHTSERDLSTCGGLESSTRSCNGRPSSLADGPRERRDSTLRALHQRRPAITPDSGTSNAYGINVQLLGGNLLGPIPVRPPSARAASVGRRLVRRCPSRSRAS